MGVGNIHYTIRYKNLRLEYRNVPFILLIDWFGDFLLFREKNIRYNFNVL